MVKEAVLDVRDVKKIKFWAPKKKKKAI